MSVLPGNVVADQNTNKNVRRPFPLIHCTGVVLTWIEVYGLCQFPFYPLKAVWWWWAFWLWRNEVCHFGYQTSSFEHLVMSITGCSKPATEAKRGLECSLTYDLPPQKISSRNCGPLSSYTTLKILGRNTPGYHLKAPRGI